jgi:hypothetical protein
VTPSMYIALTNLKQKDAQDDVSLFQSGNAYFFSVYTFLSSLPSNDKGVLIYKRKKKPLFDKASDQHTMVSRS